MITRPNFFIIGAPKCGTTAMSEYLRTHPNVYMSDPKEPAYFSEDVGPTHCRSMDEYLALFAGVKPEQTVIGEASTFYCYSDHAVQRIREFRPDAKLLVMLRRPTDLVYSLHGELLKQGLENKWDFEEAWKLQSARAAGMAVPPGSNARELDFQWIGSLGSQVERVLQLVPKEQVHFILFDDFVRDTRSEYLRLLEFLEVPDDGKTDFPRINEAVQFKSRAMARLPRYLRARMGKRVEAMKKAVGIDRLGIVEAFDRFNRQVRPSVPLRLEFRQHLDDFFRDEVILLEKLIGRDLSSWRAPRRS